MVTITFDGTYHGFLTVAFVVFEKRLTKEVIKLNRFPTSNSGLIINSDESKAERVNDALIQKIGIVGVEKFYRVFHSDIEKNWELQLKLLIQLFDEGISNFNTDSGRMMELFNDALKEVNNERHAALLQLKIHRSQDKLNYSILSPKNNVLPLLIPFCNTLLNSKEIFLWDKNREYGFHLHANHCTLVKSREQVDRNEILTPYFNESSSPYPSFQERIFSYNQFGKIRNLKNDLKNLLYEEKCF